jgi:phosphatidylglycerophosphate synthase
VSTDRKPRITCYAADEAGFMGRSQALRARFLSPLLGVLHGWRVTADHLTLLSLLAGVAFCPVFLWGSPAAALGLLLLHVVLDGLDGPLARFTGRASDRGSVTDTAADQLVVTASTLTLLHAGHAGAWSGGLYLFLYGVVVLFAFVRNALAVPYAWLVRPRFVVYAWIPVELHLWPGTLDPLLWALTALLAAKAVSGFVRIRRSL